MGTPAQIASQLRGLITQRTLYQAMQRSVLIVEGASKREAPVKTGNLRRTITSRVEQGGKRGVVGTNAPYARPVHDGQKKRDIYPSVKKALYWKGAAHPVRVVHRPAIKANPFFERAIASSRAAVERELADWGGRLFGSVR